MVPTIGLIIAVYCIVRLVLLSVEHGPNPNKHRTLAVFGWIGAILIGLLAIDLIISGTRNMPGLQ